MLNNAHMMVRRTVFTMMVTAMFASAAPLKPIPLWPGTVPGETNKGKTEHDTTTAKDNLVGGRKLMRITDISTPDLTVYPAPKNASGAAVLVFPGGGYRILAWDLEGTEVCEWLNSVGVTAVLVKYRVPAGEGQPRWAPALQDAQRAVGYVRSHAAEWGIQPNRIGVLGFSAGGHLAASVSNNYAKRTYDRADANDDASCRPDFAILIYPAYLAAEGNAGGVAADLPISSQTPPTILVQTEDDGVHVENSLAYYAGLKAAKVPVEMHLYPTGGHGYGLRRSEQTVTTWPDRVRDWLQALGITRTASASR